MRPSRWPLILHLCTACQTDCLDFTSNQPPQPVALSRSVTVTTTTTNFLVPFTDLSDSKQYDTAAIQTLSGTHVLVCVPPPSALDRTPSVSHIHGRPLWSRPRRLRVHARRLPKHHKSSSQPTISPQHPRHGRLHRPRLRPRPPSHDWLRCRRGPGHANGTIINTMLTLFLDLRPRVLGICPDILVCRVVHASHRPPNFGTIVSARHHLSPITHHPGSRSRPSPVHVRGLCRNLPNLGQRTQAWSKTT